MDRHELSALLNNFEKDFSSEIGQTRFFNFNAWQILKGSLFFALSGAHDQPAEANAHIEKNSSFLKRFASSAWSILYVAFLYISSAFKSKKELVFFYTDSSDKLAKLQNGKFFNFLTDAFVANGIVHNYIYAEQSSRGQFREPSTIRKNFNIDVFNTAIKLYQRFLAGKKDIVSVSAGLTDLLNKHFEASNVRLRVNTNLIEGAFAIFKSEYICWSTMLKALKPAVIITSEKPGSGFMAAAIKLRIPIIDLQHGVIDKHHPQYMFHPSMKALKNTMVLPTFIGVFGELHRDILLSNDFWKKEEIKIMGSSRVEMNRKNYNATVTNTSKDILLPTQWTCFEQTKTVVQKLVSIGEYPFCIQLKLHPLEPNSYVDYYKALASSNNEKIRVTEKEADIYELLNKARIVIGFDSAVLLEAVSLGRPCITLTTPAAPRGILSLFDADRLEQAIRPVAYDEFAALERLIEKTMKDDVFYNNWVMQSEKLSDYLYSKEYDKNCRDLIADIQRN